MKKKYRKLSKFIIYQQIHKWLS